MNRAYKRAVYDRMLSADYLIDQDDEFSIELNDLLSKILVANPEDRLSIGEIVAHEWFQPLSDLQAFNDRLIAGSPGGSQPGHHQSRDEIYQILNEARQTSAAQNQQITATITQMQAQNMSR